jgi:hypothetical protein
MTPELADYMRGLEVVARLRSMGMDLVPDQATITALGRAQREAEPPEPEMSPETLAALEMVKARNLRDRASMWANRHVPWYQDTGLGFLTYDSGTGRVYDHGHAMDLDLGRSPEAAQLDRPRDPIRSGGPAVGVGGPGPLANLNSDDHDRDELFDEVTWFLKNIPDPEDGEWQ